MASALLVFVGGMVLVVLFPSRLGDGFRVGIGVIVSGYFVIRLSQAIRMLRRDRRREIEESDKEEESDDQSKPKSA